MLQYQENDSVTLWVNKAAPYVNPQETYSYYSLPYCRPAADGDHKWGGLGGVLGGNDLIDSRIDIKFKSLFFNFSLCISLWFGTVLFTVIHFLLTGDVEKRSICELKLDASKIARFKYAIDNSYWFEFFMGTVFHDIFMILSILFNSFCYLTCTNFYTFLLFWVMTCDSILHGFRWFANMGYVLI